MQFVIKTRANKKITVEGALSYSIEERHIDGHPQTVFSGLLGINLLEVEIHSIYCNLALLEDIKIHTISGGSDDRHIVYSFETTRFDLEIDFINKFLQGSESDL